jgi:plastocyanin
MIKKWLSCLIVLIAILSGCVDNEPEVNTTVNETVAPTPTEAFPVREPSTVYVQIKGSAFDPPTLTVINGTTVRWTNWDSAQHVVTGPGFQSPPLDKRDNWNYTFNETGTYEYRCSIHSLTAHGRITVE